MEQSEWRMLSMQERRAAAHARGLRVSDMEQELSLASALEASREPNTAAAATAMAPVMPPPPPTSTLLANVLSSDVAGEDVLLMVDEEGDGEELVGDVVERAQPILGVHTNSSLCNARGVEAAESDIHEEKSELSELSELVESCTVGGEDVDNSALQEPQPMLVEFPYEVLQRVRMYCLVGPFVGPLMDK